MTKSRCGKCGKTVLIIHTKEKRQVRVDPDIISSTGGIVVNDKGLALREFGSKGRVPHWVGCAANETRHNDSN